MFGQERRVGVGSERCSSLARSSGRRGGSESEASVVLLWPGLLIREAIRRQARDRSECSSQRGGLESENKRCSSLARPPGWRTSVGVGTGVWPGLPVGEAVRRRAGVRSERCSSSGRRGGPESEAGVVPPRSGLPVGDLDRPSGLSFRFLGCPRSCASFATFVCWAEPLLEN